MKLITLILLSQACCSLNEDNCWLFLSALSFWVLANIILGLLLVASERWVTKKFIIQPFCIILFARNVEQITILIQIGSWHSHWGVMACRQCDDAGNVCDILCEWRLFLQTYSHGMCLCWCWSLLTINVSALFFWRWMLYKEPLHWTSTKTSLNTWPAYLFTWFYIWDFFHNVLKFVITWFEQMMSARIQGLGFVQAAWIMSSLARIVWLFTLTQYWTH